MSLEYQAEIIQAAKDGKSVEVITLGSPIEGSFEWCALTDPSNYLFNFQAYEYRVKPEPLFIEIDKSGDTYITGTHVGVMTDPEYHDTKYIELTADVRDKLGRDKSS